MKKSLNILLMVGILFSTNEMRAVDSVNQPNKDTDGKKSYLSLNVVSWKKYIPHLVGLIGVGCLCEAAFFKKNARIASLGGFLFGSFLTTYTKERNSSFKKENSDLTQDNKECLDSSSKKLYDDVIESQDELITSLREENEQLRKLNQSFKGSCRIYDSFLRRFLSFIC